MTSLVPTAGDQQGQFTEYYKFKLLPEIYNSPCLDVQAWTLYKTYCMHANSHLKGKVFISSYVKAKKK